MATASAMNGHRSSSSSSAGKACSVTASCIAVALGLSAFFAAVLLATLATGVLFARYRAQCDASLRLAQLDVESRLARILALQTELDVALANADILKRRGDEMLLELREWKRGKRRLDGLPIALEYMYEPVTVPQLAKKDPVWRAPGAKTPTPSPPAATVIPTAGAAIQRKLDDQVRVFKDAQKAARRAKREADEREKHAAAGGGSDASADAGSVLPVGGTSNTKNGARKPAPAAAPGKQKKLQAVAEPASVKEPAPDVEAGIPENEPNEDGADSEQARARDV